MARRNRAAYAEQLLQMLFGYLLKQFGKKLFCYEFEVDVAVFPHLWRVTN